MRYEISYHAAMRYRQRVSRGLSVRDARRELRERLAGLEVAPSEPPWIAGVHAGECSYVMLDEDTAVVVCERTAVTVVTRRWADHWVRRKCAELGWCGGSRESAAA